MISAIFDALFGFVKMIFSAILEVVMKFVISPLIQVALNLVIYTLSTLWYGIMVFLLKLIDFVEMLFRMLAGLPGKDNGFGTISMTFGEESGFEGGDLLLQVIMHESVREVFLSMCIVGLFLLLITTIFKIIQVEYTTEGAKNAKGPILNKAFKGLCNMVLLPILVVFGVFLGNQVLDLLDKATTLESRNPTIASVLFTTGASEAFYTQGRQPMPLSSSDLINCASTELLINLVPIVINTFTNINWTGSSSVPEEPSVYTEENQDKIIEKFMYNETTTFIRGDNYLGNIDGTSFFVDDPAERIDDHLQSNGINSESTPFLHSYGNAVAVTSYFNIANINYIVVFVGGVMILKSLFFACFGLIQRLYQCGMLFIISPAVIGMTPVNEGNLGKWRSKFIGQVLCAYGVVVAINLFFILVKIFLNLELTFTNETELQGWLFSSTFMEALLKGIFVIAGALLIDKFSKEIGSYFGADDAVSAGSDTAKGVASMATKGVMLAAGGAGMAMKGIGMATKGVKAVGGIAKKAGLSKTALLNGRGKSAEGGMKLADAEDRMKKNKGEFGDLTASRDADIQRMANLKTIEAQDPEKFKAMGLDKEVKSLEKKEARYNKLSSEMEADENTIKNASKKDKKAAQGIRAREAAKEFRDGGWKEEGKEFVKDKATGLRDKVLNRGIETKGFFMGAAGAMSGMVLPKPVQELGKFYNDSVKRAAGDSDEVQTAHTAIEESAKDRRKEALESGLTKFLINRKNAIQEEKVSKLIVQNAQIMNSKMESDAQGIISKLNNAQTELMAANARKDADGAKQANDMISYLKQQLMSMGVGSENLNRSASGQYSLSANVKLGVDADKIAGAFKTALQSHKGGLTEDALKGIIEEIMKGATDSQANMIEKIITKAISQVSSAK